MTAKWIRKDKQIEKAKEYPPSAIFQEFIAKSPQSITGRGWAEYSYNVPAVCGGFDHALYDGNLLTAIYLADKQNLLLLRDLLFPEVREEIKALKAELRKSRRINSGWAKRRQ